MNSGTHSLFNNKRTQDETKRIMSVIKEQRWEKKRQTRNVQQLMSIRDRSRKLKKKYRYSILFFSHLWVVYTLYRWLMKKRIQCNSNRLDIEPMKYIVLKLMCSNLFRTQKCIATPYRIKPPCIKFFFTH